MAEYIEREAVRCKNCIHDCVCFYREMTNDIDEWLDEFGCEYYMPAADVVEVVRCKDCKHKHNMIGDRYCYCIKHNTHIYDDDFCSYGARIDGKGDGEC